MIKYSRIFFLIFGKNDLAKLVRVFYFVLLVTVSGLPINDVQSENVQKQIDVKAEEQSKSNKMTLIQIDILKLKKKYNIFFSFSYTWCPQISAKRAS